MDRVTFHYMDFVLLLTGLGCFSFVVRVKYIGKESGSPIDRAGGQDSSWHGLVTPVQ